MRIVLAVLVLSVLAFGQTPVPAAPSYFVSLGAEYNHYTVPAEFAATAKLGVRLSDKWWSVTTVVMQPTSATIRSGAGYAVAQNGNLRLIILADAGVTTQTSTVAGAIPVPSTVMLGNIGSGVLLDYDLAGLFKGLKDKGFRATFGGQIQAVTATSVMPAISIGVVKTF